MIQNTKPWRAKSGASLWHAELESDFIDHRFVYFALVWGKHMPEVMASLLAVNNHFCCCNFNWSELTFSKDRLSKNWSEVLLLELYNPAPKFSK